MAVNNATILDRVYLNASNDYQQRIPQALIDGPEAVQSALLDINNNRYWNEFAHNLVNVIGTQKIKQLDWKNPLSIFKKDYFGDGKTYQEIATRLLDPIQYDALNTAGILKNYQQDVESRFYTVNRRVVYAVTLIQRQLRAAFNNVESGLNDFINLMINTAYVTNQYDEYRFMLQTLAAANTYDPFYNVSVPFVDDKNPTEAEIKALSLKIREIGYTLAVSPTGIYNGAGIPTITPNDKLVVLTTPTVKAALEVNVLADAFNQDRVQFQQKVITIDEFPWAGVHAMLLDEDAIISGDFLNYMDSFHNGFTGTDSFFLHAQGGYAISPFNNVIVFSNATTTNVGIVTVELDSITASLSKDGSAVTTAKPGEVLDLIVTSTGVITPANDDFVVPSNYTVKILVGGEEVNPRTYVDLNGRLHVGPNLNAGTVLDIKVTAAYLNPSSPIGTATTPIIADVSLTIS